MSPPTTIFEGNLRKATELREDIQWACMQWIKDCFDLNLRFTITEAFRSQARQNQLYAQGRTKKGRIVTWTRNSQHTQKLAVDIVPLNCTYGQIDDVAKKYGIYRSPELIRLGDLGHYSLDKVVAPIPRAPVKPEERLKGLKRRLLNMPNEQSRKLIEAEIKNLERRLGVDS